MTDEKKLSKILTDCVHLQKNKSQKVSIKNTVYASSNKALTMKKRQLMRLVILVLKQKRNPKIDQTEKLNFYRT